MLDFAVESETSSYCPKINFVDAVNAKDRTENQLSKKLHFQEARRTRVSSHKLMGIRPQLRYAEEGGAETQAEVADALEMSRSNLTRSFSRESNLSP